MATIHFGASWIGWNRWAVYLKPRGHRSRGRIIAVFNGKFARKRAHARAARLENKARTELMTRIKPCIPPRAIAN